MRFDRQWLNRNAGLLIRAQAMSWAAVSRRAAACSTLISTSRRRATSAGRAGPASWRTRARPAAPGASRRPAAGPGSRSAASVLALQLGVHRRGSTPAARSSGPSVRTSGATARTARKSSGRLGPIGLATAGDREPEPAERPDVGVLVVQLDRQHRAARPRRPAARSRTSPSGSTPVAGETAQPLPASLALPSIALAIGKPAWLKSARALLELDRLGLLGVGLGRGGDLELVEHEVAVGGPARARCSAAGCRPGPRGGAR